MPATRSRSSTEAVEAATEEVKQVAAEESVKESIVDAPVVADEVAPSEAEAVPVTESSIPVVEEEEPIVAPVVETNGNSEAVPETNGNGHAVDEVPVVHEDNGVVEKRKSEIGGEGDGPDSTDAAVPAIKKAKVADESEVSAEEAVPLVEASV